MTSKELIEALRKEDPDGDTEVCVGNIPIYFLGNEAAYWDGRLEMLIQDHSKDPYYNIVGYKVTGRGRKVQLHLMDLDDVILDDPDTPVDLSELEDQTKEMWKERVEDLREETKKIIAQVNEGMSPSSK